MEKHWRILQPDPSRIRELCGRLHCSPIIAAILVNRNLQTPDEASKFLRPSIKHLRPPCGLKDMQAAVERVTRAIEKQEKIMIFGDYDVDGVTGAAILYDFLLKAGANVSYYIPHRIEEGYSLKADHIDKVAVPTGIDLIVTADCGSGSHAAVQRANAAGIDVVVTDHHRVSDTLPSAVAVVNPKRPDCTAGFEHLAGVGVAMALLICLRKHLRESGVWHTRSEPNLKALCDLVALGTIADAVPLVDENRIFVTAGIEVIRSGRARTGIIGILNNCRMSSRDVDAEDLAFKIVPRLNAAGRMDHALLAARLLLTENRETAKETADSLDELNNRRKDTERQILQQIKQYLKDHPQELNHRVLVLSHEDWHEGVLGIVASRLVERHYRPVVLISTREGIGKGSARSIFGFNLYRGLTACADQLENFGGHGMAAGLGIRTENISAFKNAFEQAAAIASVDIVPAPEIRIDCVLGFEQITDQLIDEIDALQPFGSGNSQPLFMAGDVQVIRSQIVGDRHRRMRLTQSGTGRSFPAIQFNIDPSQALPERLKKIAFHLQWNRWNGVKSAQMVIEEIVATFP
ncbi:MAG: single-stranded-DNA-specific exonuclease RecJ [Desulfobacterales bacterium]